MSKYDLSNERSLRAWAIEQVMGSSMAPGASSATAAPDFITVAQRIVDFVSGDGAAKKHEGGEKP
jgi:hypothetical protein